MESTPVPLTPMTPGKFEALFEMPPQAEEMDGATALSQLRQHMSSAASAADADADAAVAAAFAFPPGDSSSGAPFADFCLDDVGVSVDELLPPGDFVLQQYAAPPGPADVTAAYASAAYASAAPAALELSMGMDADADADADADDRQLELDMDDALMEELEGYSPHSASASSTGETPVSGRASSAVSSDEGSSGTDAGADASNKPFAKRARQRMAEELTPREIELLRKEGFEMPANRRLTKDQEKQLKKLRRKIKNKMSAQDSRKRKKQEREELEKRCVRRPILLLFVVVWRGFFFTPFPPLPPVSSPSPSLSPQHRLLRQQQHAADGKGHQPGKVKPGHGHAAAQPARAAGPAAAQGRHRRHGADAAGRVLHRLHAPGRRARQRPRPLQHGRRRARQRRLLPRRLVRARGRAQQLLPCPHPALCA